MKKYLLPLSLLLIALICQVHTCNAQIDFNPKEGRFFTVDGKTTDKKVIYKDMVLKDGNMYRFIDCEVFVKGDIKASGMPKMVFVNSVLHYYGKSNIKSSNIIKIRLKKIKI